MDRALHQLTVLVASGAIMVIALSAGFSPNQSSDLMESYQPATQITKNLSN